MTSKSMKSDTVRRSLLVDREQVYSRREIRKADCVFEYAEGWVIVLGRCDSSPHSPIFLADDGETETPETARLFADCAEAMETCAAIMRESSSGLYVQDFPAPEFPRVAFLKQSAQVWLASNA